MAVEAKRLIEYADIKNNIHAGIIPSFDWLQRYQDTEHFKEGFKIFSILFEAQAIWLKYVLDVLGVAEGIENPSIELIKEQLELMGNGD